MGFMTDEEIFELVRNAYSEANKDYLAEQIEIASSMGKCKETGEEK